MSCIYFCVIYKYRVKQLTIYERTVAAEFDFKNCAMVDCDNDCQLHQSQPTAPSLPPSVVSRKR